MGRRRRASAASESQHPVSESSQPLAATVRPMRRRVLVIAGISLTVCAAVAFGAYTARSSKSLPQIVEGDGVRGPKGMVWVPGGEFLMGSDHKLSQRNERPAHKVRVGGFWMDRTHVTNAQFAAFVKATGYVTTADRKPDWEMLRVQVPPGTPQPADSALVPGAMVFVGTQKAVPLNDYAQWWRFVP